MNLKSKAVMGLRVFAVMLPGPLCCPVQILMERVVNRFGFCQDSTGYGVITTFQTAGFCVIPLKDFSYNTSNYNPGILVEGGCDGVCTLYL